MRLLMKKTIDGARDGARVETFHEGKSYAFGSAKREVELVEVFLREGWAEEIADAAPTPPEAPKDERRVYRLPLLEEFVKAGRAPEGYNEFIKLETAGAEKNGFRVEVRAPNEAELAAAELERKEFEAREKQIEDERSARDAAQAEPAPPPADAAPTPPEAPKSKHSSGHKKGK